MKDKAFLFIFSELPQCFHDDLWLNQIAKLGKHIQEQSELKNNNQK